MKTKLDRLLESTDPSKTIEAVSARIDEAINSFRVKSGIIDDWDTFTVVMGRFFRHLENHVLQIGSFSSLDPEFDWGHCRRMLIKEYGFNGEKTAFDMARTGLDRGFYGILKAVGEQMIKEYAQNEISARVYHFWDPLSVKEKLAAIDEYLEKYGHLLPSELTEDCAGRVKMEFVKILAEHPYLIRRLRKTGRG